MFSKMLSEKALAAELAAKLAIDSVPQPALSTQSRKKNDVQSRLRQKINTKQSSSEQLKATAAAASQAVTLAIQENPRKASQILRKTMASLPGRIRLKVKKTNDKSEQPDIRGFLFKLDSRKFYEKQIKGGVLYTLELPLPGDLSLTVSVIGKNEQPPTVSILNYKGSEAWELRGEKSLSTVLELFQEERDALQKTLKDCEPNGALHVASPEKSEASVTVTTVEAKPSPEIESTVKTEEKVPVIESKPKAKIKGPAIDTAAKAKPAAAIKPTIKPEEKIPEIKAKSKAKAKAKAPAFVLSRNALAFSPALKRSIQTASAEEPFAIAMQAYRKQISPLLAELPLQQWQNTSFPFMPGADLPEAYGYWFCKKSGAANEPLPLLTQSPWFMEITERLGDLSITEALNELVCQDGFRMSIQPAFYAGQEELLSQHTKAGLEKQFAAYDALLRKFPAENPKMDFGVEHSKLTCLVNKSLILLLQCHRDGGIDFADLRTSMASAFKLCDKMGKNSCVGVAAAETVEQVSIAKKQLLDTYLLTMAMLHACTAVFTRAEPGIKKELGSCLVEASMRIQNSQPLIEAELKLEAMQQQAMMAFRPF